jgi:hypothetical protein
MIGMGRHVPTKLTVSSSMSEWFVDTLGELVNATDTGG